MDAVIRAHAARVRAADPLVAGQDELRGKDESRGRGELRGQGHVEARGAVGWATVERVDPGSMRASWSPLVVHRLQARVAGPSPEAALGALLDTWLAGIPLDEQGQALTVTWPSRDVAPVRALAARNFAPVVAQAVRAGIAGTAQGAGVRRATPDDLETLARLYERLVAYDAHFGWVAVRASTAARIRAFLASEVMPTEWCWLAEGADGTPLGGRCSRTWPTGTRRRRACGPCCSTTPCPTRSRPRSGRVAATARSTPSGYATWGCDVGSRPQGRPSAR
ncbi:hypothetical protein [Nonomuraea wenchangensis]|uniref:Uncharacterized protein n=1 Tax=Nonomuraea wenchangensis TaxID=568860 RepID=A0A1I0LBS6_9ACTN|nr:hypothetical protein [Nonomuraea wenchangensis]SEU36986.1 hypothetical protein SAMN05421811_11461 [Nonomuraea wenchangensis]